MANEFEGSYIDWARRYLVTAKYNIGRSGLPPLTPDEFGLDISKLPVTVEDFAALRDYEARVAARYDVAPECVIATTGSSHANMLAAMAYVRHGDNVVVEQPAYEPLVTLFEYFGAEVRRLQRRFEAGFIPDPGELATLVDSRTKLLVLTNPHNPTGAHFDADTMRVLAGAMARVGGYVLVDEIYIDYFFENTPAPGSSVADNVIVTSSLTKVYGLGTLRAGWLLAARDLTAAIRRGIDYSVGNVSFPSCLLGTMVFDDFERFKEIARAKVAANRPHLVKFLTETPEIEAVVPPAGIVAFPRIKDARFDAMTLFHHLLSKYETTIVPGVFFDKFTRHFRVCVGPPTEIIEPGLANLKLALAELAARD